MGFVKGGMFIFVSVLLFLSLLMFNFFMTAVFSLSNDNVKKEFSPVMRDLASKVPDAMERFNILDFSEFDVQSVVDEKFESMKIYCDSYETYGFIFNGQVIEIPCPYVQKGKEAVIDKTIEEFIDGIYYEDYECSGFLDCFSKEESPFFLISEKSKDYSASKAWLFLFVSLVLGGILFFLGEDKSNVFIVVGGIIVVSAISFFKASELVFYLLSSNSLRFFSFFVEAFLAKMNLSKGILLMLGFVLVGVGITMKIGLLDSKKKKFSLDEIKKIIHDEKGKEEKTDNKGIKIEKKGEKLKRD